MMLVYNSQDLVIDAIYADIIRGKLDQKHQQLEVDFAVGRDLRPEHVQEISKVLDSWLVDNSSVNCESKLTVCRTFFPAHTPTDILPIYNYFLTFFLTLTVK